jgi:hypothetical protein
VTGDPVSDPASVSPHSASVMPPYRTDVRQAARPRTPCSHLWSMMSPFPYSADGSRSGPDSHRRGHGSRNTVGFRSNRHPSVTVTRLTKFLVRHLT